ncbi:MAG: hypothetical protein F6K35_44240, partial [Okeania sp. SIO2H7]|nr:hypothetical protein [Okeania sp. SIO2H7]
MKKSAITILTVAGVLAAGSLVNTQPIKAQEGDQTPPYCEGNLPDGFVKCVYNNGERQADRYEGE